MAETYNGWTNYETWAVNLWMNNDRGSQGHFLDMAREAKRGESNKRARVYDLANSLKAEFDEQNPLGDDCSVWTDLLGAALCSVNWIEIAEHLLDDIDDEDDAEDEDEDDIEDEDD